MLLILAGDSRGRSFRNGITAHTLSKKNVFSWWNMAWVSLRTSLLVHQRAGLRSELSSASLVQTVSKKSGVGCWGRHGLCWPVHEHPKYGLDGQIVFAA